MTTYENNNNEAPNANDFLGGNYLKKEDIEGEMTVTMTNVWSESVLNSRRKKLIASFREFEKPLILNKTNIRCLAQIFGTVDTTVWRGVVTLYVEAAVEFGGRVVGGIRVRPTRKASVTTTTHRQPTQVNGHTLPEDLDETSVDFF